jgi:hypothetical protein
MNSFKSLFVEIFTVMAWLLLSAYIFICTFYGFKDDSIRDAWNILIFISGYVWGKSSFDKAKNGITDNKTTTAEISATITQEPINNEENNAK